MEENQPIPETGISILYEDQELVAVAKPSGMFVHRSLADRSATTFLVQTVRDQIGCYVYPIHRLDRPTSGLVMLAKSTDAAGVYGQLMMSRQLSKTYVALVRGYAPDRVLVDRPLVSSRGHRKQPGNPQAAPQPAITHIRTIKKAEVPISSGRHATTRLSLVKAEPKTGRYHQIRRHLAGLSYPVIGDAEHGDSRLNRLLQQHLQISRLMLAAVRVQFQHPRTNAEIIIDCPLEESFLSVLTRLEEFSH